MAGTVAAEGGGKEEREQKRWIERLPRWDLF